MFPLPQYEAIRVPRQVQQCPVHLVTHEGRIHRPLGHTENQLHPLPSQYRRGDMVRVHICHDLQRSGACRTYFPWPQTRCVDPRSILVEQHTMPDEATKVGMRNTDAHVCVPSLFSSQRVYIYPTSTGNFPSLEIN